MSQRDFSEVSALGFPIPLILLNLACQRVDKVKPEENASVFLRYDPTLLEAVFLTDSKSKIGYFDLNPTGQSNWTLRLTFFPRRSTGYK